MLYNANKIHYLLVVSLLTAFSASAQTVNDIPIKDIDVEYIQIIGTSKPFSKGVSIQIDFGQKTKFFSTGKETVLKDKDGKIMDFNSMIDALNFMAKNGFEFVNAFAIAVSNQNVYHYLMKNIKNTLE
ncbi:MAG: hypothetical protein J0I84_21965 [Terrimonas sp.]|nr:hypothetical protein [Terrimonas sp.]OJY98226.1 MAG: hypothetical protein BGP13_11315 [Sphingobacteriales bacterium 40-81]